MVICSIRRVPAKVVVCLSLFNAAAPGVQAAHPLITEDTGTQGSGNWQIELTYDRGRVDQPGVRETGEDDALVLSYGLGESLDVILSLPYHRIRPAGAPTVQGPGDATIGAKWRFHEHGGLSLALRPGVSFATGDEQQGLGSGRSVPSVFAVATRTSGPWALHLHAGYTHNRNVLGEREAITHASVAVARRFGESVQLVTDISRETNPDRTTSEPVASAVLGLIYSLNKDFDLDIGYRAGLTDATPDHALLLGLAARF